VLFLCGHGNGLMQFRFNPNHGLSGVGLFWGFTAFRAELEIVVNRVVKCLAELCYRLALKGDNIPKVEKPMQSELVKKWTTHHYLRKESQISP